MKVTLRPWKTEDAERLSVIANDAQIAQNLRNAFPFPYTLEHAVQYIAVCQAAPKKDALFYAIEAEEALAGSIAVMRFNDVYCRSAEIGYWLAREYWGRGIMTQAVKDVCTEAFCAMDIVRIQAEVFERNIPSQRVLQKAGFIREAVLHQNVWKNGKLENSCLYALLK